MGFLGGFMGLLWVFWGVYALWGGGGGLGAFWGLRFRWFQLEAFFTGAAWDVGSRRGVGVEVARWEEKRTAML